MTDGKTGFLGAHDKAIKENVFVFYQDTLVKDKLPLIGVRFTMLDA